MNELKNEESKSLIICAWIFLKKKLPDKPHDAPVFFIFFLIVELDQIQIQSKLKSISKCFKKKIYIVKILGIVFILMVAIQVTASLKHS